MSAFRWFIHNGRDADHELFKEQIIVIDIQNAIRDVTDEELAFYEDHGWVMLKGLVAPDVVKDLLKESERLKAELDEELKSQKDDPDAKFRSIKTDDYVASWGSSTFQMRHIRLEPFLQFALAKGMGRVAHQVINRASLTDEVIPIQYLEDALLCKTAAGTANSGEISYHQDLFGTDRYGGVNIWVALDRVTPDMGAMRFLERTHLLGPLGRSFEESVLDRYPKLLDRYQWSIPLHYEPGDTTVHHEYLVHGSPPNISDKTRWSYACTYAANDCVLAPDDPEAAHTLGMPAPHERFPVVYP